MTWFRTNDYAEVWVNGQMPRAIGRPSPATTQGFILGINGPISLAPPNPVFFREAKIELFK